MVSCHDMKKGQVFACNGCGLELQVVSECKECGEAPNSCECDSHCDFSCCGEPMKLK